MEIRRGWVLLRQFSKCYNLWGGLFMLRHPRFTATPRLCRSERINPGDEAHTEEETTEALSSLYGMITTVHRAKDIRTAEARRRSSRMCRGI